jgi:hypothetical protein
LSASDERRTFLKPLEQAFLPPPGALVGTRLNASLKHTLTALVPDPIFRLTMRGVTNIFRPNMEHDLDISRLLVLRNLTTHLAEHFTRLLREYLTNLAPLLQPRVLLGDLIRSEKQSVRDQDAAFQQLLKLYQPLSRTTALNVQAELKPPLDIFNTPIEFVRATYTYSPQGSTKPITIASPLKWVLVYKDLGPQPLRELIASHARSGGNELQSCVLHYLTMSLLAQKRPGAAPILDALRFPLSVAANQEFGGVPFVYISAPVLTMRPPDSIIVQSSKLSGATTFEEVVDVDDISRLSDPLKGQVVTLVKEHGGEVARELGW